MRILQNCEKIKVQKETSQNIDDKIILINHSYINMFTMIKLKKLKLVISILFVKDKKRRLHIIIIIYKIFNIKITISIYFSSILNLIIFIKINIYSISKIFAKNILTSIESFLFKNIKYCKNLIFTITIFHLLLILYY